MQTEFHAEVPKDLPKFLKEYAKAALNEKPEDLLQWSVVQEVLWKEFESVYQRTSYPNFEIIETKSEV